ncbi:MAG: ArsA family ATPase [Bacteroidales bacterium]|nr:ArsA family ATPase [Bacteroidales bacterium]
MDIADKRIVFFLGKGGVGKTSLSAISAKYFAFKGKNTAVFSFDSAHNLADVFGVKLSDNLKLVNDFLWAAEINTEKWRKKYLEDSKQNLQSNYSYLASYDYLKYFDILEFAPDIDSTSLLLAFKQIVDSSEHEILIIDMPPTALSLQFFDLVKRNQIWLSHLLELREKIHKKKQIISKIKYRKRTLETDKILVRLKILLSQYNEIASILKYSVFIIVQNPDKLSVLEAGRIKKVFSDKKYRRVYSVINKADVDVGEVCFLNQINGFNLNDFDFIEKRNQAYFKWLNSVTINPQT